MGVVVLRGSPNPTAGKVDEIGRVETDLHLVHNPVW